MCQKKFYYSRTLEALVNFMEVLNSKRIGRFDEEEEWKILQKYIIELNRFKATEKLL